MYRPDKGKGEDGGRVRSGKGQGGTVTGENRKTPGIIQRHRKVQRSKIN